MEIDSHEIGPGLSHIVMHPAFFTFLYTFFLLHQDSRKTSDKRQETAFDYGKYSKRYKGYYRTSGLLIVVPIPIQHVVVVRTHGPILHRHPLDQTIRSKDQVLHLQSGAVTLNLFLAVMEEGRDYRVGG